MELSPLMRQYYRIKAKYDDAILFFRVGDFYETFDEDAKIASRELGIALTSTSRGKGRRIPMAGVPCHAAAPYIKKLVERGYKVAICEQLEEPKGKDVVKRDVVRVVTPGTVFEETLLDERSSNYLMSVNFSGGKKGVKTGVALVEVSTGEFLVTEFEDDEEHTQLLNELARLRPAEILLPASLFPDEEQEGDEHEAAACESLVKKLERLKNELGIGGMTGYDDYYFDVKTAYTILINHFKVISLDGFGCSEMHAAVGAAGAAISYLRDTQKSALTHISTLRTFSVSDFMVLDATTLRNLEIFKNIKDGSLRGTLLGVIDKTLTPMGARLLKKWLRFPLLDVAEINRRLDAVEELYNDALLRAELRDILSEIHDVERIIGRVSYGSANARDLVALKRSLRELDKLKELLSGVRAGKLRALWAALGNFSELVELIERSIVESPPPTVKEGGIIKKGFNEELDELRRLKQEGRRWLLNFEERERRRTGIKSLKVGYNKIFGYYIEVPRSQLRKVPPNYVRKQTLANAERFVTEELKDYEAKVLGAEERIKGLEYAIFEEVRAEVARRAKEIQSVSAAVAELDVLLSFAEAAAENGYVRPEVNDGYDIVIKDGRHPVVELELRERGENFVPNDVHLSKENRLMIITGPNMSGKSTFMRQVALITLMAQLGSFVPASRAKVGVVDRIFTRVGAYDDLAMGQSSFMVEMNETANILNNATERSLIILDEIGRGTSTLDGVSIAWAVAEYIHERIRAKTMFATHFYELTALEDLYENIKCYNVSVREEGGEIFFVRKVVRGKGSKSYGIQVAKLAGIPPTIIERARAVMTEIEEGEVAVGEGGSGNRDDATEKKAAASEGNASSDESIEEVIEKLRALDLERMTPIEALNKLYELKKLLDG